MRFTFHRVSKDGRTVLGTTLAHTIGEARFLLARAADAKHPWPKGSYVTSAASLATPSPFTDPPAKPCIRGCGRTVEPGVSNSLCQPCKVAYNKAHRRAQFAASKRKQRASATFRATENAKAKDRMRTLRAS